MKNKIFLTLLILAVFTACENLNLNEDLNLNPLAEGSIENWYSTEEEVNMALNDLYIDDYWLLPYITSSSNNPGMWTDDCNSRNLVSSIAGGTINGQSGYVESVWYQSYKAISHANVVLENLDRIKNEFSQETIEKFEAEARFVRAYMYSKLILFFGDVVFYTERIDIEDAFTLGRTDKITILQTIYNDFDFAITHLPTTYESNEIKRATKGAAIALKARIALYNSDWEIAQQEAKACIDLGIYSLYPDFGELFLSKTKNPDEVIFAIPRSVDLNVYLGKNFPVKGCVTRTAGGWASWGPTWDLFASFLCTDGLPIDESPLFNPRNPFENRDPRCSETFVPFQTEHLGIMYQPHPDSTEVLNFTTGKYVFNKDTRSNGQYASYNGLVWKKMIDEDWTDDFKAENDEILIRYADVLLMYAEASIELGQIDQSVLDAMNMVRARAYKVDIAQTGNFPAITTTNQAELSKILRIERRMEFAWEKLRYMDIIRWKIAEKVLTNNIYGMLDPADLQTDVIPQGLWFWPETPQIDDDGIPDFSSMYNSGYCKILAIRKFDATKQYLWPIPTKEILINENLQQNPGY